jgi:hypothetical protein
MSVSFLFARFERALEIKNPKTREERIDYTVCSINSIQKPRIGVSALASESNKTRLPNKLGISRLPYSG